MTTAQNRDINGPAGDLGGGVSEGKFPLFLIRPPGIQDQIHPVKIGVRIKSGKDQEDSFDSSP